jgi:hypothetical protein
MATLTYDPTEAQEGEFSKEEQESIKVGEALEEQQQQLLAGKFKDAEDLESAYIELQRKLGDPSRDEPEAEADTTEPEEKVEKEEKEREDIDTAFLDRLWEESQQDSFNEETLKELGEMDPKDLANMYLEYRSNNSVETQQLTEADADSLKGIVGGDAEYKSMINWAKENLNEQEIQMYDTVMNRAEPLSCFFAVQALANRYQDSTGVDGELLTGKPASNKQDVYRSQAEVVRAMDDSRYEKDPAYRQDIYDKLERSNLQF